MLTLKAPNKICSKQTIHMKYQGLFNKSWHFKWIVCQYQDFFSKQKIHMKCRLVFSKKLQKK